MAPIRVASDISHVRGVNMGIYEDVVVAYRLLPVLYYATWNGCQQGQLIYAKEGPHNPAFVVFHSTRERSLPRATQQAQARCCSRITLPVWPRHPTACGKSWSIRAAVCCGPRWSRTAATRWGTYRENIDAGTTITALEAKAIS